jgi:hypothetical protein
VLCGLDVKHKTIWQLLLREGGTLSTRSHRLRLILCRGFLE